MTLIRTPESQCHGKQRYVSKREAKTILKVLPREWGSEANPMCAYRCPHCGGWHVGHRPAEAA